MYLTEVLICISQVTSATEYLRKDFYADPCAHTPDSTLKASPGESEGEAGRGVGGQGLLPNQDLRLQSQAAAGLSGNSSVISEECAGYP